MKEEEEGRKEKGQQQGDAVGVQCLLCVRLSVCPSVCWSSVCVIWTHGPVCLSRGAQTAEGEMQGVAQENLSLFTPSNRCFDCLELQAGPSFHPIHQLPPPTDIQCGVKRQGRRLLRAMGEGRMARVGPKL